MYPRICKPLLSNSFFLFGSRGTGKSTLLQEIFKGKKTLWIDLLDDEEARQYLLRPALLEERVPADGSWVVIDEVQRVPSLLNYVHRLIEKRKTKFALTGSSARKLKRGAANLLAGRAFLNYLHPLTSVELSKAFDLNMALHWGTLPKLFSLANDLERREYLRTYCHTYLREEIKEEQIIRQVEPFVRFLEVAAQCNGEPLNFSKIGRDSGTDPKAVERYYQILEDTLVGFFLNPFHRSIRKRQTQRSKFYFFDVGVKRSLEGSLQVPLLPRTSEFGKAFEHFLILECMRLNDYLRKEYRFSYLRTKDDLEIDLVIERPGKKLVLLEIKSADRVDEMEISRLANLRSDLNPCELWIASQEKIPRTIGKTEILPWQTVLNRLYG